jgi:hypothetical protein
VRRVDAATGIITTVAGTGVAGYNGDGIPELLAQLSFPNDVLLEPSGSFLIADTSNNRVRRAALACVPGDPPQISLSLDPVLLWPPNHRMVAVEASVYPAAGCGDLQISLASVVSDEPDDAPGGGDGNTDDDIQDADIDTDDRSFSVRAERSGAGSGRTYLVTYTATDAGGQTASATATVSVPLSKAGGVDPVSVSVDEGNHGTFLTWDPVPDTLFYNVIRGAITNVRETTTSIDLGPVVCLEARSQNTTTFSKPDAERPPEGGAFFYLVEYDAGYWSGYGAESVSKPSVPSAGACP